jgi:hypothetical protein
MKSFSILRTNVGLTTNVKVVCDSFYNLYLESIDSDPELSINKLKKMQFNKNNFFDELVPYFFKDFPSDTAFKVFNFEDSDNMSSDFANQYDDIYNMGAKNIINNKNYPEEYEYFAPLYIFKESFPKYFIIFRIDGPGLEDLNSENFRQNFLKNFKTVKVFDLTKKTSLGEWIDRNFVNNKSFPVASMEVDFRNLEFSRWYGIDYDSGGFTYKSQFLDDSLENENTLFDLERYFFDGYKRNKIIFPQILNFSFLFDDSPSTPTTSRKWSINRYSGFYIEDLEMIDCFTPFIMPKLKSDISVLDGNILYSPTGDPFVLGFNDERDMYVEYDGDFYKVEKFTETASKKSLSSNISKNPPKRLLNEKVSKIEISRKFTQETIKKEEFKTITTTKYRIISEIDLEGKQSLLNKKTCFVDSDNRIIKLDGSTYDIIGFENSDINLIEIDGVYHNIILEDGYLKLKTDYGFNFVADYRFEYFAAGNTKFIDLFITNNNKPICFKVFRLKFTDIKDFDTQIVDNEFSKFEYEKIDELSDTEESKMYTTDLRSNSNPPTFNDYIYKNDVVFLPCSSDYTANLETFRIVDGRLSDLWLKNPIHCRFAFQKSLSANDYPYLLNNNDIHENYNRTTDTNNYLPTRTSRNLDYFYTINSGTYSYQHHSLHIEKNLSSNQDSNFNFELDKYLNLSTYTVDNISMTYSFDYFNSFFGGTQSFVENGFVKNVKKYSYFDSGDSGIPNTTLFRGLKFKIYEVESLIKNEVSVENINAFSSNKFNNYKFSILLSRNFYNVDENGELYKPFEWLNFTKIKNQPGVGGSEYLAIVTGSGTPSNLESGDVVKIVQYIPKSKEQIDGYASVTYVGNLGSGEYGFVTNKSLTQSFTQSGYYSQNFQWKVVKNWELNNFYQSGDKVLYEDVLYDVTVDNSIDDPNLDPTNLTQYYSTSVLTYPFWNPEHTYSQYDFCYKDGEFYIRNDVDESIGINFWNPKITYTPNSIVNLKGKYYKLTKETASVKEKPEQNNAKNNMSSSIKKWSELPEPKTWYAYEEEFSEFSEELWDKASVWKDDEYYFENDYVVYDKTLYKYTSDTDDLGIIPSDDENCSRVYSFEPETDFVYKPDSNPVIQIGESYYLCVYNKTNTLESGINILINKKHKNILINIIVNDETISNLNNATRDDLYVDSNQRITAANFIRQFNDLDSKYDFSDYTSYIVVDEDGTISKYNFDNNLENLPFVMLCEEPDSFELKNDSLKYKSNSPTRTQLKPLKFLVNGEVDSIEKLNYYNEIPLGCEIERNDDEKPFGVNYNGRSNITISKNATVKPKSNANISETFYRHSGYYMPLFYEIELFKSQGQYDSLQGNYVFDNNLSNFGIVKQRVMSKINRKGSILKLKDSENIKSIYPMLDEFGYMVSDFFLFKSTWDYKYHVECKQPNTTLITTALKDKMIYIDRVSIKNNNLQK